MAANGAFNSGNAPTTISSNNPSGGHPGYPPPGPAPVSKADNVETGQANLKGAFDGTVRPVV